MAKRADHAREHQVRYRAHVGFIAACAVFAAIFVALVLSAFHSPAPHGLPVGVVAPAKATGQLARGLSEADQGGFDLRVYRSEDAARAGIRHRDVDGALIADGGPLRLLVTSAGGTAPAQALTKAFGALAVHTGQRLVVVDVVASNAEDTEGLSPFFIVLSVLIPSLVAGSASAIAFRRASPVWCVAAPVVAAVVIGVVAAGIGYGVSGLGHFAGIAGLVALFSLATSAPTAALGRLWPPLVSVAVLAFVVFGIPVSGGPANLAGFTPGFLRVLHPALPLGVAADAVRNLVYFGGHATAPHVWVLTAWAAAGLVALALVVSWRMRTVQGSGFQEASIHPAPAIAGASRALSPVGLVVGFDDSAPARRALAWALQLLTTRPGSLHVVYADHGVLDSDLSGFAHAEMAAMRDDEADGVAAAAAQLAAGAGVAYTFERRQGAPADVILAEARAQAEASVPAGAGSQAPAGVGSGGSVIVVGRSGHAARHIMGSVSVRLLHRSPYPVLTIP